MRAITVCVEYADLLAITLPYNIYHFEEVGIVTSSKDQETQDLVMEMMMTLNRPIRLFVNDLFYEDGAIFNKWRALESALDEFGRRGLMCIMDADVLWPREIGTHDQFKKGVLYSPRRRLLREVMQDIPLEHDWNRLELFNDREFAGYSQIFHANDPHLPNPPWYQIDWTHAGGADSFFQNLWPSELKRRPRWEVLHLGSPGANWCGRCTIRRDGKIPVGAEGRSDSLRKVWGARRRNKNYSAERVPKG